MPIAYVSGTHGSGKSMLIKQLGVQGYVIHPQIDTLMLEHPVHRLLARVPRYYKESLDLKQYASTVLADRCIYDNYAYAKAFVRLGWMTTEDEVFHHALTMKYFAAEELPRNIIFIDPPREWVVERLQERWLQKGPKWRETDLSYLTAVMDGFKTIYSRVQGNILHLHCTGLEERIKGSIEWLRAI
jgi:hypothetical protein